jgi:dolichyl-phosphate-mannose-protein mannosyltransferase
VPRWIILAILLLVVLGRSAIFVIAPESYFDADQAVFGLMAKHLAELRAFPLFMYGQSYILGVEAWMAAPLFAVFGPSSTALKMPLLVLNLVIAWLLVRMLERELGLRPAIAAVAALPFVLPAVATAAVFVEPSGGNLEPYLYVLLIWVTRNRPIWCGVIFGIGFLHREFTAYALAAILAIESFDRTLFSRQGLARRGALVGSAAIVWLVVQLLKRFSSASGPGTSFDSVYGASNNILELAARTCISPATALSGGTRLVSIHWPALLGTRAYALTAFSIESAGSQGLAWSSWLPLLVVGLATTGIAVGLRRGSRQVPRFAVYLILVGLFSCAGYVFGRCGEVNFYAMRYELLSILAIIGINAWFLSGPPPRALAMIWGVALAAWLAVLAVPHVRLVAEYVTHPPVPAKRQLIRVLENKGVRYGTADYWLAYYIDFMTSERMLFAADEPQRIKSYNAILAAHASDAIHLSRRRCEGGTVLIPGVYQCP